MTDLQMEWLELESIALSPASLQNTGSKTPSGAAIFGYVTTEAACSITTYQGTLHIDGDTARMDVMLAARYTRDADGQVRRHVDVCSGLELYFVATADGRIQCTGLLRQTSLSRCA